MRRRTIAKVVMKFNTSILALPCLAALTVCAAPSHAQDLAKQLPTKSHVSAAAGADMSAANELATKLRQGGAVPLATETCSYQFTSGSGNTYLQFCSTVNGNIVQFTNPAGVEQLTPQGAAPLEGYGICDATEGVEYYDYAYIDSGNWNATTLVSHSSTSVKFERTTSDGLWTLTQTITQESGNRPAAQIAMAIKNNSGITKTAELVRYANAIPDNSGSTGVYVENYDGTLNSAFGWLGENGTANGGPYGLMLEAYGNPTPTSVSYAREGFAIDTFDGPDPCNSGANWVGLITNNDGSLVYWYALTLAKDKTATVTERYTAY